MRPGHYKFFILCILLVSSGFLFAQTTSYSQLCNELQFARSINDKWATEVFLGGVFSSTPTTEHVLNTNIQRYAAAWGHYYFSPRWKFSGSLAYFYNKDVPDIGQYFSPEYRLSVQAIYYLHKTGYTLLTRMRGELRYMMNEEGIFEDKYRYRQQLKYLRPLNSKFLHQGVVYFITTEELLFKPHAKTEGITFFDRNRFEIGAGYLITDDLQLEATYLNEFMPRDNRNEMYNAIQLTLTVNNLLTKLKKLTSAKAPETPEN
jgi:hypothetical protein